jgi:hypothetical protein
MRCVVIVVIPGTLLCGELNWSCSGPTSLCDGEHSQVDLSDGQIAVSVSVSVLYNTVRW